MLTVKYKLVQKKDMTKGAAAGAKRFYASVNINGNMSIDEIIERIADRSMASDTDILGVIRGLIYCVKQALRSGQSVTIPDLGTFKVALGSSGTVAKADFKPSMLRRPRVVFRPHPDLNAVAQAVSLECTNLDPKTEAGGSDDNKPDSI